MTSAKHSPRRLRARTYNWGVELARRYKESREVIHAIEAHHGDVEPQTMIAMLVDAADDLSAARPGARREDLENYIKRLQKLEEIANSFDGVEKSFALQAGREIRIMVKPEKVSDERMVLVARDVVKKIESEMEYPGQIKVSIIRESRTVDYANNSLSRPSEMFCLDAKRETLREPAHVIRRAAPFFFFLLCKK